MMAVCERCPRPYNRTPRNPSVYDECHVGALPGIGGRARRATGHRDVIGRGWRRLSTTATATLRSHRHTRSTPSSAGRERRNLTAAVLLSDFDFPKRSRQSQSQPVEPTSLAEEGFPSRAFPNGHCDSPVCRCRSHPTPRAPDPEAATIQQKTRQLGLRVAELSPAARATEASRDTHAVGTLQMADRAPHARGRTIHCVP
jgi:hypothetical protein